MMPVDIDRLKVAKPCGVAWDSMTGDEQRRRCGMCELDVYNLEEMSRREVTRLLSKPDGRICGRIRRRADGTIIMRDCPKGIRDFGLRMARFAGAALSAVLAMFSVSYGQTESTPSDKGVTGDIAVVLHRNLSVRILDQTGAVLEGASISVQKRDSDVKMLFTTDRHGEIKTHLKPGVYDLTVTMDGFETKTISDFKIESDRPRQINVELMVKQVRQSGPRIISEELNFNGVVVDQSGAVIAGTTVVAINKKTAAQIEIGTDENGRFADYLEPGTYELRIAAAGFDTSLVLNLKIEQGKIENLVIQLEPSKGTVEIGIFFKEPMIDFNKTDISTTVFRRP